MSKIVAKISEEVQALFQELTDAEAVSIGTVEARVSGAVGSWGQRLSEAVLSQTASSPAVSPVSVPCPSCQKHSHRYRGSGSGPLQPFVASSRSAGGNINVNVAVFMSRGRHVKV